ncbi:MAG: sulfite exporter TauE/SafE family protein [Candidatus Methanospirareceae archaeon]
MISVEMVAFMVVAGALVGLISSFFGVGACFIMVPVMMYCFERFFMVNPSLSALIAFGTNMAIVVPTALSGTIRHRKVLKAKNFKFPTSHYIRFAIPVGIGSVIGSLITFSFYEAYPRSAGIILKTIFGIFCIFGAYRFMVAKPLQIEELKPPSTAKYGTAGLLSAIVAHFIGIGGGIVYMPVLNSFLSIPVHLAVPLSLATMCIGSSVGATSFALLGHLDQIRNAAIYPPLSFGWFNLIAFAFIGIVSILFAQLGPILAHRTSPQKFKILLAALYVYIGIRLILRGIYQLQGLTPPLP